jgi:predicted transcriptional regulator of viral defense system
MGRGEIFRIKRGFYADKPKINPFLLVVTKYPNAIITMDTAFFIYGLTDVIPDNTYLATMRNATRISDTGVVQVFLSEKIFKPGKSSLEYDGVSIIIYDRERMLIELLRNSKSIPFDYYKEIITGYRRISDELDFRKVEDYMLLFKRNDYLYDKLRREVL